MGVVSFIVGVVSFIVGVVSFIVCVEVCSCHNEDQGASDDSSRLQLWEDGLHWSQKVYTHTPSILDTERSLTHSLSLSLLAVKTCPDWLQGSMPESSRNWGSL